MRRVWREKRLGRVRSEREYSRENDGSRERYEIGEWGER